MNSTNSEIIGSCHCYTLYPKCWRSSISNLSNIFEKLNIICHRQYAFRHWVDIYIATDLTVYLPDSANGSKYFPHESFIHVVMDEVQHLHNKCWCIIEFRSSTTLFLLDANDLIVTINKISSHPISARWFHPYLHCRYKRPINSKQRFRNDFRIIRRKL